jgi:hypothetical protein
MSSGSTCGRTIYGLHDAHLVAFFFTKPQSHYDGSVNQHCSRKSFVTRFMGLLAAGGLTPRLLAKIARPAPAAPAGPPASFALRPEPRSVPRRADVI